MIRGNNVSVPEEAADDVDANIDRLLRGELPAGTTTEHNDSASNTGIFRLTSCIFFVCAILER